MIKSEEFLSIFYYISQKKLRNPRILPKILSRIFIHKLILITNIENTKIMKMYIKTLLKDFNEGHKVSLLGSRPSDRIKTLAYVFLTLGSCFALVLLNRLYVHNSIENIKSYSL